MAWFNYGCPKHGLFRVSLPKREKTYKCKEEGCEEICRPSLPVSTFQVVERLDNGAMARAVERLHNIEEIMEERDRKSTERYNEIHKGADDEIFE